MNRDRLLGRCFLVFHFPPGSRVIVSGKENSLRVKIKTMGRRCRRRSETKVVERG